MILNLKMNAVIAENLAKMIFVIKNVEQIILTIKLINYERNERN